MDRVIGAVHDMDPTPTDIEFIGAARLTRVAETRSPLGMRLNGLPKWRCPIGEAHACYFFFRFTGVSTDGRGNSFEGVCCSCMSVASRATMSG